MPGNCGGTRGELPRRRRRRRCKSTRAAELEIESQAGQRHGEPNRQCFRSWLPRIRSGELHFSLCYSEPEAGSDLAALRLRADLDHSGSHYVLNGQKCWQSYAQDMDFLWVLARTGTQESRGKGLSLFICDAHAPGVTVRPLPTLDGDQLNEVFFDDVRIPDYNRVGEEHAAWSIIGEALADERHIQFPPGRVRRGVAGRIGQRRNPVRHAEPEPSDLGAARAAPGVGESRAQAIVALRKERGAFKAVDEITQVKGIGDAMLERLRPLVRVTGRSASKRP